jgi:hypothetical protein
MLFECKRVPSHSLSFLCHFLMSILSLSSSFSYLSPFLFSSFFLLFPYRSSLCLCFLFLHTNGPSIFLSLSEITLNPPSFLVFHNGETRSVHYGLPALNPWDFDQMGSGEMQEWKWSFEWMFDPINKFF